MPRIIEEVRADLVKLGVRQAQIDVHRYASGPAFFTEAPALLIGLFDQTATCNLDTDADQVVARRFTFAA
jgi:hypothetical protein